MRETLLALFDEAVANGASQYKAADLMQVPQRTLRRWRTSQGHVLPDLRPLAIRPEPKNKLSEKERQHILNVCNEADYANLPPVKSCQNWPIRENISPASQAYIVC